jgi:hypothetical protein
MSGSEMPDVFKLAVHMEDDGRDQLYRFGFRSTDLMAGPVSTALLRSGLPYQEPFVCIAVYGASENPHDERAPAYRAFGPPVILKPSLINEIKIACCMDFQNAVSNHRNIHKVFRDLRDKTSNEIEKELLFLLSQRPPETWAEARMFDFLTPKDVAEDAYKAISYL